MNRKEKSEAKLKELGIPINPHLPKIESEEEVKLRSPKEIADRAIVLCSVAACGEGHAQQEAIDFLRERNLWDATTQKERDFLLNANINEQDRINFTWRYESLWVLLWSLGYIEELNYPSTICDVPQAVNIILNTPHEQFLRQAKLRSVSEILDEADLIYRYDWAVVEACTHNKEVPCELDPGVVYERHYSLNWLIGYMDQEWDNVTTDT